MACHELGCAIAGRIGPGDHRQALQVASEILRELLDRTVAPLRLPAHGHQNDIVQIAAQAAALHRSSRHTGPFRFAAADDPLLAREQPKQQHTE